MQEIPESEEIEGYLAKLRESVQAMHCAVEDQRLKQRLLNKKRARGENLVNFTVGDFVLRSRVDEKQGDKLQVTWVGPYRVVRADTHSFRVQHLVTGDELDVHASRLKMYADEDFEVTDELLEHVSAQGIVQAVDKLVSHRWNNDIKNYEIKVRWKGLESIEDSYEPLTDLEKEIRILVDNYVRQAEDQQLVNQTFNRESYLLGTENLTWMKQVWGRPRLGWMRTKSLYNLKVAKRGREPQLRGSRRILAANRATPIDILGTEARAANPTVEARVVTVTERWRW
uniref:Chromo domain-containing protein n=1 Tax=Phytophthora ramorum TaxID=164328 RepID=H3H8F2_PHYRM